MKAKEQEKTRINKYISHNSKYSRREVDELIKQGRVTVNKKVVTDMSLQVNDEDHIYIDKKAIKRKDKYTVIVYHKPKGEIVSKSDPQGRRTIYDSLPKKYSHFLSVGRLDYASSGVLLLSDAVDIVHKLTNSKLERVYNLKIKGYVTNAMETAMQEGLELDDARAGGHKSSNIQEMSFAPFYAYKIIKNATPYSKLKVVISEGKNRELRRFFAHFNAEVVDLKRVSFGGIELNALPEGKTRFLETKEYDNLRAFLKV